jgi:hypothetical protein
MLLRLRKMSIDCDSTSTEPRVLKLLSFMRTQNVEKFSGSFRNAATRHKRDGLDVSDPVNYRPIANVTFLSKLLERIVDNQLIAYLDVNELVPAVKAVGHWRNHSTETLLLRLLSDLNSTMNHGQVTLLALFDESR